MKPRMTFSEWNEIYPQLKDKSAERPQGFLMVGQRMKGRVEFKGKVYDVCAWQIADEGFVTTQLVTR